MLITPFISIFICAGPRPYFFMSSIDNTTNSYLLKIVKSCAYLGVNIYARYFIPNIQSFSDVIDNIKNCPFDCVDSSIGFLFNHQYRRKLKGVIRD